MGLFPDVRYQELQIALTTGAAILVYTDGVTDALNSRGDEFGEETLLSCCASLPKGANAETICQLLSNAVWSVGVEQFDDITILVLSAEWPRPNGRLLPKRTGYEIAVERMTAHANRMAASLRSTRVRIGFDLSAESARLAAMAGIEIAVSTDAHSTHEFDLIRYGIDQARRAGLDKIFRFQPSVLAKTWRANRT
jgi:hypothetical protein